MNELSSKSLHIAILHIRHAWSGGAERFINYLAQYLCEKGHRVTIVCRKHEEAPHPNVDFVVLKPFFIGDAHKIYAFGKAVEKHLQSHDYDVVFGFNRTWTQDIYRMGGGCHQTYLDNAHSYIKSAWKDFINLEFLKNKVILAIEKKALSPDGAKVVVVNSNLVKRDIIKRYGVDESRIQVIYNGVDLERYCPNPDKQFRRQMREGLGISEDDFLLISVGNNFGLKGVDRMIDAMRVLAPANKQLKLLVVGTDSHEGDWKRKVRSFGLESSIIFIGGRKDVVQLLQASDLFVLLSRHDPFSNATLEAMACGLPVITADTNGASELIADGLHGQVVGDQAKDALIAALSEWLDFAKIEKASKAARALAERFSVEVKMNELLQLIEYVAQKKSL